MIKRISSFILAMAAAFALCSPVHAGPFAGGPVTADRIKNTTVGNLPPAALGRIAVVTDGSTTSDCTVGGGANAVICYHNGTAWTAIISSGTTDLTGSVTWTIGDGSSGDVVLTFNGDAGTDGTFTWDVSEDAFVVSSVLKLFADANLDSSGLIDDAGDIGFDVSFWDTGRGTILGWDGTQIVAYIAIPITSTPTPGQTLKYQSGGTWAPAADNDAGAPSITATHVAYATALNTIGGEAALTYNDSTNTFYVDNIVLAPSATPTSSQYDSNTTDSEISTQQVTNCTDTGSGTEDCDYTMRQKINGTLTDIITADASVPKILFYSSFSVSSDGYLYLPRSATGADDFMIENTAASGASNGAGLSLYSNDGAAVVNGDRLAIIRFGGSEDAIGTLGAPSAIAAHAKGTWTTSSIPSSLTLYTTPSGSLNRVAAITIDENQQVSLSAPITFLAANNPTTDAEGECAWDANNDAFECYDGAASRLIPTLYSLHKTIMDPDGVQAVEDAIPLMEVTADWAPFGITIKDIELSADAANTGVYTIEEWTDPTTASSDVETLTFASATEIADDGTLTDASIAAGSFVMIDLSNTALNFLGVTITYYINEGN